MKKIYIGCKSCIIDDNGKKIDTVQVWEARTGKQIGEFELNSPKIPEGCIICYSEAYFWRKMEIYAPEDAKELCRKESCRIR